MIGISSQPVVTSKLPFLLFCVLTAVLGGIEDGTFKRQSSESEAEALSKQIAKQVRCQVCVLASKVVAEQMQNRTIKREHDLLGVIASVCKGGKEQDHIDRVLEKAGWSVEGNVSSGFKLVQREILDEKTAMMHQYEDRGYAPLKGGELSLGRHKRDGVVEACMLSVNEYESELTEYLFIRLQQKKSVGDEVVADKLCLELSGACLDKKPQVGDAEEYNGLAEPDEHIDDPDVGEQKGEEEDDENQEDDEHEDGDGEEDNAGDDDDTNDGQETEDVASVGREDL